MRNFTLVLFLFISVSLCCQDFSKQWAGHYSYFKISDLFATEDRIYAASENAMFIYDVNNSSIETLSTVNGLAGETIATLYYSSNNDYIVVGYENGLLQVVLSDGTVRTFIDILEKPTISPDAKRINHFFEDGDILYVSTGFGIVEFNLANLEFGDTFFIGPGGTQINVTGVAVLDSTIYVTSSENGVLTADRNNPNLVDFNQWTQTLTGNYQNIFLFDDQVYIQESDLIRRLLTLTVVVNAPSLIKNINISSNSLTISLENQCVIYDANFQEVTSVVSTVEDPFSLNNSIAVGDLLFLGTENQGLLRTGITNTTERMVVSPNGPLHNDPFRVKASNGNLWVTYGRYSVSLNPFPLQRRGISRLKSDGWKNILNENLFGVSSLSHITINPDNEEQLYISSFQDGLLEINDETATVLYNTSNSGFESLVQGEEVLRMNGSAFTRDGDLWIVNSRVNTGLNRFSPDTGEVFKVNLQSVVPSTITDLGYSDLVLDRAENVFMGTFRNGVVAYNPDSGQLTKITRGLPDLSVDALAMDQNDQLWIGTRKGLRVFFNSSGVFQQNNPEADQIIIVDDQNVPQELLFDQFITDIEVDGSNNKWVATESSGVFYFSSDGQETLAHFTVDNSPLPDNGILDVSVDDSTGSVYFATQKGLLEFKGTATGPEENLDNVIAFPNPVRPGFSGNVTIRGLTSRSNVKITDIEGNLVYEEVSQGGSIQWDTTAFGRHKVASGVYLILVTGEDRAETTVSKLLIVR